MRAFRLVRAPRFERLVARLAPKTWILIFTTATFDLPSQVLTMFHVAAAKRGCTVFMNTIYMVSALSQTEADKGWTRMGERGLLLSDPGRQGGDIVYYTKGCTIKSPECIQPTLTRKNIKCNHSVYREGGHTIVSP